MCNIELKFRFSLRELAKITLEILFNRNAPLMENGDVKKCQGKQYHTHLAYARK